MLKRISLSMILIVALLSSTFVTVFAQSSGPIDPQTPAPSAETGEVVDETPSLWFVELQSPPTSNGTKLSTLDAEKSAFRDKAAQSGLDYTERFAFSDLWNGVSISVPLSQISLLARIPGVKAIYPVETISIPDDQVSASPQLYTSVQMIGADIVQNELGYTGKGVKVAVMDTGIDYDHPDLGGCFGPGCRVAYGYDLVGDAYNSDPSSDAYDPVPNPDPYPDDCNGHGTHVAGIIGANGVVKGVAPDVTFGAYRVFGCEGSTESDIMLAAMERAKADHMQVLNMSIGSSYQWPQYPTSQASDRLVAAGMVVVASIGNDGATGVYSASSPGVGERVIGVASVDNTNVFLPYFDVNGQHVGFVTMDFAPTAASAGPSYRHRSRRRRPGRS